MTSTAVSTPVSTSASTPTFTSTISVSAPISSSVERYAPENDGNDGNISNNNSCEGDSDSENEQQKTKECYERGKAENAVAGFLKVGAKKKTKKQIKLMKERKKERC